MSEDCEYSMIDTSGQGLGYERFSHEAMATLFEIFVCTPDRSYAQQCVHEAFALLDRLEGQLSHFITNSDVSRINTSSVGEPIIVGLETFACLELAQEFWKITEGAFDVTLGRLTRPANGFGSRLGNLSSEPGMEALVLDKEVSTVTRMSPDIQLDLGGIGKGFALDQMAGVLRMWGLVRALLHGGGSTVLALDGPETDKGWPVTISDPRDLDRVVRTLYLQKGALSGSSHSDHAHIIDPRPGRYITGRHSTWAYAGKAVTADVLSTAFMLMDRDQIESCCLRNSGIGAAVVQSFGDKGEIQFIGYWP